MFEVTITPGHQMTKDEARQWEEKILHNNYNSGEILLKIREERGWAALGFSSFKEHDGQSLQEMGLSSAYRIADQAEVNRGLSEGMGRKVVLPLTHALVLKELEPEQRLLAFKEAIATNPRPDCEGCFRAVRAQADPALLEA